jgi:signal transduction histidine kinase
MGMNLETLPAHLAPELWDVIVGQDIGEPAQWRPSGDRDFMLSSTRYPLEGSGWMLLLNEISQKQSELAYRLHQQRLETLGRVVATAVHDLRAPLSSIVFGLDVLARRPVRPDRVRTRSIIRDVRAASFRLRETIDCLLDFVRLGPPVSAEVSIRQVLARLQSLLRPQLRPARARGRDRRGRVRDREPADDRAGLRQPGRELAGGGPGSDDGARLDECAG